MTGRRQKGHGGDGGIERVRRGWGLTGQKPLPPGLSSFPTQGAPNTKPHHISTSLRDPSGSNPYERLGIVREPAKGSTRCTLVTSK